MCICGAYNGMAHIVGAGPCTAEEWAFSIFQNENSDCQNCSCNRGNLCEVATGSESIKECEVYQKAKNDRGFPLYFHPLPEDFWEKKIREEEVRYEYF